MGKANKIRIEKDGNGGKRKGKAGEILQGENDREGKGREGEGEERRKGGNER